MPPENDVAIVTNALQQTTYYYYTNGNLTSVVDPINHTTTFTILNGLLTKITDALNHDMTFGYDQYGNINLMRDANNVETRE